MARWYKERWLLAIIAVAAVLALANLGSRHFWGDEVHLLNLGKSVAKYGIPVVDDELKKIESTYEVNDVTHESFSDTLTYGNRMAGRTVYSLHPWLVSYIAAVPIALFGPHHEFWIRLPFVLIGLLAIPVTFALAWQLTRRRRVALMAAGLLAFSTVFLLAVRNANYYGLILFAVPATVLAYWRFINRKRHAGWQFALAGAMVFHSQWLVFMGVMLGLGMHFLLWHRKDKEQWKRIALPLAGLFVLTFPWFVATSQLDKTSALSSPAQYVLFLAISAYHFVMWFVPLVVLTFVPLLIVSRRKKQWVVDEGFAMLALVVGCSFLFSALNAYTGTPVRYYYGLLPFAMLFTAMVLDKLWKKKLALAIGLLALLVATNLVHVVPVLPFKQTLSSIAGSHDVLGTGGAAQVEFVTKTLRPRFLLWEYLYEITHNVISPTRVIIDAIAQAPKKGTDIFVGVADANSIGYYTGLRPATYANNFHTRVYDWIVLSVDDPRNAEVSTQAYARKQIMLATERWGDTADPAHHLFGTKAEPGFYLYRRLG